MGVSKRAPTAGGLEPAAGTCHNADCQARHGRHNPKKNRALTVEVAFTVTRLYLARMLQRTLPAGFIAPCLPTKNRNPRCPRQTEIHFILTSKMQTGDHGQSCVSIAQGATMTDIETALANCRALINQINAGLSAKEPFVDVSSATELIFYLERAASALKKSLSRPRERGETNIAPNYY